LIAASTSPFLSPVVFETDREALALTVDFGMRPGLRIAFAQDLFAELPLLCQSRAALSCYAFQTGHDRSRLDVLVDVRTNGRSASHELYVWAENRLDRLAQSSLWDEGGLITLVRNTPGPSTAQAAASAVACVRVDAGEWFRHARRPPVLDIEDQCVLALLAAQWIRFPRGELKMALPIAIGRLMARDADGAGFPDEEAVLHCGDSELQEWMSDVCEDKYRALSSVDPASGPGKFAALIDSTLLTMIRSRACAQSRPASATTRAWCRALLGLLGFSDVETDYLLMLSVRHRSALTSVLPS